MTLRIRHLILAALLVLALPAGAAAQSSEDTSGADQYTEQGIPGAEEDTSSDEPAPTDPAPTPVPSDTSGTTSTPAADVAATADTTSLPRTGAEAGWLALMAAAFLGSGLLLRRALPHQSG